MKKTNRVLALALSVTMLSFGGTAMADTSADMMGNGLKVMGKGTLKALLGGPVTVGTKLIMGDRLSSSPEADARYEKKRDAKLRRASLTPSERVVDTSKRIVTVPIAHVSNAVVRGVKVSWNGLGSAVTGGFQAFSGAGKGTANVLSSGFDAVSFESGTHVMDSMAESFGRSASNASERAKEFDQGAPRMECLPCALAVLPFLQ